MSQGGGEMIAIGIDPGLSGAVVAVDDAVDSPIVYWRDTPTVQLAKGKVKRDYAVTEMRKLLQQLPGGATVFLEQQQAFPGQGVSSTFQTGRGFGLWEGLLAGQACFPYETVRPVAWQRVMLAGVNGEGKARSLLRAGQLFPELPLTRPRGRKPCMDGRSDAALIALYGLRRMRGEA